MYQFYSNFGGGVAQSNITLLGILCEAIAILLLFMLPRKYAALPILLTAFLLPMNQVLVIGGLHFMAIRVILAFGWIRVILAALQGQWSNYRFEVNAVDKAVVWWAVFSVIIYTLLWRDSAAFLNRAGLLYSSLGVYFLFRCFVRDVEDVDRLIRYFAYMTAILAVSMFLERFTGHNLFSVFGDVPLYIRDGKIRAEATFGNYILAGTFGATLFPLFLGLGWYQRRSRLLSVIGMVSGIVMILTCASATPVLAFGGAIVGFCFWPFRRNMRMVRWGVVTMLVGLALVMKAPIWALIGRVDILGGSSEQREALVDGFIRHFWDWFLIGSRDYASWNYYTVDTDNQFVYEGVNGGLITLSCFTAIIVFAFKNLGRARKAIDGIDRQGEKRLWALGVALWAQIVAFWGVSYFDNSEVWWLALNAMILAAAAPVAVALAAEAKPDFAFSRNRASVPVLARSKGGA